MTRVQAEVRGAVKDWLAGQNLGATVALSVPTDWTARKGPLLIVADDGGPVRLPIKSRHTVRLTAYAPGPTEARRIATVAAGKLAESAPRPEGIAHVSKDIGGVLDARDKETGAYLASVLVPVTARTVEV
ncbi:hypothetical protein [Mycobacteroides abscessus]|uniref:hypothetical protein n=1 Tax=Mycobacteroides abscessus TaxID=36809 RepID=UPI0009CB0C15|nr:hypothetical protein [Mycobacteroides abscessus]MDB2211828.1 hypothetical protein [Mycobacteroides abscessus subsp. massiliense]MDB2235322.1 hypothetical protein [Mycobacteroides abscessus subsp. massiliense]WJJ56054.1 tail terminator [Mycobacterium phage prophiT36-2b]SKO29053.1 Uncharacterised protein [Mycobacteroides abscessus subsp. massiliense]